MAQPLRKAEEFPRDAEEARAAKERYEREAPAATGLARAPEADEVDVRPEVPQTSLGAEVRPRIVHSHKGDVGRPGTNEEIYQGSKEKELK